MNLQLESKIMVELAAILKPHLSLATGSVSIYQLLFGAPPSPRLKEALKKEAATNRAARLYAFRSLLNFEGVHNFDLISGLIYQYYFFQTLIILNPDQPTTYHQLLETLLADRCEGAKRQFRYLIARFFPDYQRGRDNIVGLTTYHHYIKLALTTMSSKFQVHPALQEVITWYQEKQSKALVLNEVSPQRLTVLKQILALLITAQVQGESFNEVYLSTCRKLNFSLELFQISRLAPLVTAVKVYWHNCTKTQLPIQQIAVVFDLLRLTWTLSAISQQDYPPLNQQIRKAYTMEMALDSLPRLQRKELAQYLSFYLLEQIKDDWESARRLIQPLLPELRNLNQALSHLINEDNYHQSLVTTFSLNPLLTSDQEELIRLRSEIAIYEQKTEQFHSLLNTRDQEIMTLLIKTLNDPRFLCPLDRLALAKNHSNQEIRTTALNFFNAAARFGLELAEEELVGQPYSLDNVSESQYRLEAGSQTTGAVQVVAPGYKFKNQLIMPIKIKEVT